MYIILQRAYNIKNSDNMSSLDFRIFPLLKKPTRQPELFFYFRKIEIEENPRRFTARVTLFDNADKQ